MEIEFANLRVAFRWAADRANLDVATAIAAHSTMLAIDLQPLESVGWAEEILPAAIAADVRHLPRLFAAASFCFLTGTRAEVGVGYAETAVMLEVDPRYESFEPGWAKFMEASSHLYAGRNDRYLQICADLVAQTGSARLRGLCGMTNQLARNGREAEAMALAEETLAAARSHASPFWIAFALNAYGQAFVNADPRRALLVLREGLAYARQHRLPFWEVIIGPDLARLEAVHGDPDQALVLFEDAVESFHQVGNSSHLFLCLAGMAVVYAHLDRPEIAATLYGHIREQPAVLAAAASDMATVANLVRSIVGDTVFEKCVSAGAAMDLTDAVRYARHQIQLSRIELAGDRPDSP